MIYSLEGPDCCGKTTQFELLKRQLPGFRCIKLSPMHESMLLGMPNFEQRTAELWSYLYDSSCNYLVDRSFVLSACVYSQLFNRPLLVDWKAWQPHIRVAYIGVPFEELRKRHMLRGDKLFSAQQFVRCIALYEEWLTRFQHHVFDGLQEPEKLASQIREWILCS